MDGLLVEGRAQSGSFKCNNYAFINGAGAGSS